MGVDPEGPEGVVEVENDDFGEGEAVGEGFGGGDVGGDDGRAEGGGTGFFGHDWEGNAEEGEQEYSVWTSGWRSIDEVHQMQERDGDVHLAGQCFSTAASVKADRSASEVWNGIVYGESCVNAREDQYLKDWRVNASSAGRIDKWQTEKAPGQTFEYSQTAVQAPRRLASGQ